MTAVVVTMAGESRRFRDAGYDVPKYRLRVREQSLFAWSIESLRWYFENGSRLVLVGRADDPGLDDFVTRECAALGAPAPELVQLDRPTSGQAETVLAAAPFLGADEQLAIFNIDTHVRPGALAGETLTGDGCIPCFPGTGDAWSFVAAAPDGRATAVREKERISPHASVGLYAFRDLALYREAYAATAPTELASGRRERFIAPMYQVLIDSGYDVHMTSLDHSDITPLGTPEEALRVGPITRP